jgi:translation initiation factor IF-3
LGQIPLRADETTCQKQQESEAVEIKQVRLGLKIGEHDLQVKLNRAVKFLEQGHKVKISLLFRGREITRPELGRAILDRVMEQLNEVAAQEQAPQLSGRDLNMIVGPKKDAKA